MSQTPPEATPAGSGTPAAPAATPPWGTPEDFNPEKAWNLIQNLQADKDKLGKREALTPEAKQELAEFRRLKEISQSDLEREQAEKTRWQNEAERWRQSTVAASIREFAATDFADPTDAAAALADPSKYIDVSGVVDEAAIKADLAALLDKKPHWRRQDGTPAPITRPPAPNGAQGTSGTRTAATPAEELGAILTAKLRGQ